MKKLSIFSMTLIFVSIFINICFAGWPGDPEVNIKITQDSEAYEEIVNIVTDDNGGDIVVWKQSWEPSYIKAKRVDSEGNTLWHPDGVTVGLSFGGYRTDGTITAFPDGTGGAWVIWVDQNSGGIFYQRVTHDGELVWNTEKHLSIGSTNMICDSAGNLYYVWSEWDSYLSTYVIYAGKIDINGNTPWGEAGIRVCANNSYQNYPALVSDDNGGVIIAWTDKRNGNEDIFAERLDPSGQQLWSADSSGVAVCDTTNSQAGYDGLFINRDGTGGAHIVWEDYRDGGDYPDLYAQRIDNNGNTVWQNDGELLWENTINGYAGNFKFISPSTSNSVLTWSYGYNPATILGQRLTETGFAWTQPKIITEADNYFYSTCPDQADGFFIAFIKQSMSYPDILASRIDAQGNLVSGWNAVGDTVCNAQYSQEFPLIVPSENSSAIITWLDHRASDYSDLYSQKIYSDASLGNAPPPVDSLQAYGSDGSVTLTWEQSPDTGVDRYVIYRSTDFTVSPSDSFVDAYGNATTSYTDSAVVNHTTYFYRIAAVDDSARSSGRRSALGTTAAATPGDYTNIVFVSGTISGKRVFSGDSLYVIADALDGSVSYLQVDTLIIQPGTIIKLTEYSTGYIQVNEKLKAMGTATDSIIFTSLNDDSYGGDTNQDGNLTTPETKDYDQIFLGSSNAITDSLSHCLIKYGNGGLETYKGLTISKSTFYSASGTAIDLSGANYTALIDSCEFFDIGYAAIDRSDSIGVVISNCHIASGRINISGNYLDPSSNPYTSSIEDCIFDPNSPVANYRAIDVYKENKLSVERCIITDWEKGMVTNDSEITVSNCDIYNNSDYGIRNITDVYVSAENNWWGHSHGPTIASNPNGNGDVVTDDVDYYPWLVEAYNFDSPPSPPVELTSDIYFNGDQTAVDSVNLIWAENLESDISSYKVYRDDNPDLLTPTLVGTVSEPFFVDITAEINNTYYYAVKAMDAINQQSEFSDSHGAHLSNILYVDQDATGSVNGYNWTDAFTDLQDALALSDTLPHIDQIWVAAGTYYPTSDTDRYKSFYLREHLAIYGGFVGNEISLDERNWLTNPSILSGNIGATSDSTDNSYHVVYADHVDSTAILDGVTIRDGYANGSYPDPSDGGGLYCDGSSDSLSHCHPIIQNCSFINNYSSESGGAIYNYGNGGVCTPQFVNCSMTENNSDYYGGAMANEDSNPHVINCFFGGNTSASSGGAIYNESAFVTMTDITFVNCVITGNYSAYGGGGILNFAGTSTPCHPNFINCTIANNYASDRGGGMQTSGYDDVDCHPQIKNSIIFGNRSATTHPNIHNVTPTSIPSYHNSDIEGSGGSGNWNPSFGTDNGNNIDADPIFLMPQPAINAPTILGDYHLSHASPAIDMGDDLSLPPDVADLNNDGDTSQSIPLDMDYHPRQIDGNDDNTDVVDMGAYEYPGPPIEDSFALEFDGADDYVTMGAQDSLMLAETHFTIEAWIRTTQTGNSFVVSKHQPGSYNGYLIGINSGGGYGAQKKVYFYTADNPGDEAISTVDINDGKWHHIAAVYYTFGSKYLYVDGVMEDNRTAPEMISTNSAPFMIGALSTGGYFDGQIDDVRVWNCPLTQEQIKNNMLEYLDGSEQYLGSYWRMNEGSGETVYDLGGNGYDGQIYGASWMETNWPYANPQISGHITQNTTWTDTVEIIGDVTVDDNVILTIDPGTRVEFQGHYNLDVIGTLLAVGTEQAPITFTINDTTGFSNMSISDGGWHGIRFDDGYNGANGAMADNDSSKIVHCDLEYGKAIGSSGDEDRAGAIYVSYFDKLLISNCALSNNVAQGDGGAIYFGSCNPKLMNNRITHNSASGHGGAIYSIYASPTIVNNIISDNTSSQQGGGIWGYGGTPTIVNNVIDGNTATSGGGIFSLAATYMLTNNTISHNIASQGGGIFCDHSHLTITNCILWNDSPEEIYFYDMDDSSSVSISHSDIDGGQAGIVTNYNGTVNWGEGNISSSPSFMNTGDHPYNLSFNSPCINNGNPDTTGLSLPEYDLIGNPRIYYGETAIIDMGAYEYQGEPVPIDSIPGLAVAFDGTQRYVEVPDAPNLRPGYGSRTIALWAKIPAQDQSSILLEKAQPEYPYEQYTIWVNGPNMEVADPGKRIVVNYIQEGGVTERNCYTNDDIADGKWHHIAVVFDQPNDDIRIYVDGENKSVTSEENGDWPTINNPDPLRFGYDDVLDPEVYSLATIDEVSFWNTVLTQNQIRANMHNTLIGNENGLICYWQFNDDPIDGAVDVIGGNVGTYYNQNLIPSTAPIGPGDTYAHMINSTGVYDFTDTDLSMNFTQKTGTDTVVVTRLNHSPNQIPPELDSVYPDQYWIVNKYGSGSFTTDLTFTLDGYLTAEDADMPYSIKLYTRDSNSDSSWTHLADATAIDLANNSVTFSGINTFSQLLMGRLQPTPISDPRAGKALTFDGTDDYVNCGNDSTLNITNEITLEAWIRFNGNPYQITQNRTYIVDKQGSWGLWYSADGEGMSAPDQIYFDLEDWHGVNTDISNWKANKWYHIAATYNGTVAKMYVNGELNNQRYFSKNLHTSTSDLTFGSSSDISSYFEGLVDEIRLWDIARDKSKIRENMHKVLYGYESGLISYWQFNDDGYYTTVQDIVSGNDGMMYNMDSYASWYQSDVPIAGGFSNTQLVASTGEYTFPETDMSMNFTEKSGIDNMVVTRIDYYPNIDPPYSEIDEAFNSEYWVVNQFGNGTFTADMSFVTSGTLTSDDEINPQFIKLYWRSSNSFTDWTYLASADSVDVSGGKVRFSGISATGQFMLARKITDPDQTPETALQFDGVDDYVALPNMIDNQPYGTIEAWVKYTDATPASNGSFIFSAKDTMGITKVALGIHGGNDLRFGIYDDGSGWIWATSGVVPVENRWYHVAANWSPDGIYLYIDGVQKDYKIVTFSSISECFIGKRLNGTIDELKIWNANYSLEFIDNIRNNMHLTRDASDAYLQNYYQFNDGAGSSSLFDVIGYQNGTLMNMDTTSDWLESTAPIGSGYYGDYTDFQNANAYLAGVTVADTADNFDNPTDMVVTQIGQRPNILPAGINHALLDRYWVIRPFGNEPGDYLLTLTFDLPYGYIGSQDQQMPSNLVLFRRSSNSDSAWIQETTAIHASNYSITFNNINQLSQFSIGTTGDSPLGLPQPPSYIYANWEGYYISVEWMSDSDGMSYNVYKNTEPDTSTAEHIATIEGCVSSCYFSDYDVSPSTVYYYWVTGVRDDDESECSQMATAIPDRDIWYVDIDADPNVANGGPEYPFTTITEAMNNADSDDVIYVLPGIYEENLSWPYGEGITLKSTNGADSTHITRYMGTGIEIYGGDSIIDTHTVIDGFTIEVSDRRASTLGSAIYLSQASPLITNCQIQNNHVSFGNAGGIECYDYSSPKIENTYLVNNSGRKGGGIYCEQSSPIINKCTLYDNTSQTAGAIYCEASNPIVINSILWGNSLAEVYFGTGFDSSQIAISHSDVKYGEAGIITNNNGTVDWLTGNMDADPLFADTLNYDLSLQEGSPCIDAGTPDFSYQGMTWVEMSPYEYSGGAPDMGAYESGVSCPSTNIVFVDVNATGDNDGSSWEDGFTDLQDGLALAGQCGTVDQIWVADGTYYPTDTSDRTSTFHLVNGVAIYGGFSGGETDISQRSLNAMTPTILSGNIGTAGDSLDNSYHVVTASNTDTTAVLDGFTIAYGCARDSFPYNSGAGIFNESGNPAIKNCHLMYNTAWRGAGIYNSESNMKITSCNFSYNQADGDGGGIYSDSSNVEIKNSRFRYNTAGSGGAISNFSSNYKIIKSDFVDNSANIGGAITNFYVSGVAHIINCRFVGNTAGGEGGGIYNKDSSPTVVNCLFNGNQAITQNQVQEDVVGGAIRNYEFSHPEIINCTFTHNAADTSGGALFNSDYSIPTIYNSIFWNNLAPFGAQIYNLDEPAEADYCIVEDGYPQGTNISTADPLFLDANGADNTHGTLDDDLRLRFISPAVGGGENSYVPTDQFDLDGDGDIAEKIPYDLEGNNRIAGVDVDLGAYERAGVFVFPKTIVFPSTTVNTIEPPKDTISVYNTGNGTELIFGATGQNSNFIISDNLQNITIAPNSTFSFEVAFLPQTVGVHTDTLILHTSRGVKRVSLSGTGVPGVVIQEGWYPEWVINDGGITPPGQGTEYIAFAQIHGADIGSQYEYQVRFYQKDSAGNPTEYSGFTYQWLGQNWVSAQDTSGFPIVNITTDPKLFIAPFKTDHESMPDSLAGNDWYFSINIRPVDSNQGFSEDLDIPITVGTLDNMGWITTIIDDQGNIDRAPLSRRVGTAFSSPPKSLYISEPNGIEDGNPDEPGFIRWGVPSDMDLNIAFRDTTNETFLEISDTTYSVAGNDTTDIGALVYIGSMSLIDSFTTTGSLIELPVMLNNPIKAIDTLGFRMTFNSDVAEVDTILQTVRSQNMGLTANINGDTLIVRLKDMTGSDVIPNGSGAVLLIRIQISEDAPLGTRQPFSFKNIWASEQIPTRSDGRVVLHPISGKLYIVSSNEGEFRATPDSLVMLLPPDVTAARTFVIRNLGASEDTIQLSSLNDWITLSADSVTVASCDTASFTAYFSTASFSLDQTVEGNIFMEGSDWDEASVVKISTIGYKYDLDYDYRVTVEDIQMMVKKLSEVSSSGYLLRYDINEDGVINKKDISEIIQRWGEIWTEE